MNRSDIGREVKPGLRGGETVESHGVVGENDSVEAKAADSDTDMASAKANRKEAYEPEREAAEKSAVSERSVPAKNVIGHGERNVVACNTMGGDDVYADTQRGKVNAKNTM